MKKNIIHNSADRRKVRTRAKLFGTAERPRVSLFRSNKAIYVQAIDDVAQKTIASNSTLNLSRQGIVKKERMLEQAKKLGNAFGEQLKKIKVNAGVLDRGPYAYKGNVQSFTDGLREGGITI